MIGLSLLVVLALILAPGQPVAAAPVGLGVEALENRNAFICPVCHKAIVPGEIRERAKNILWTEMGEYLDEKGIDHTGTKEAPRGLNVLIYRFRERMGGDFAVDKPASVGFHVHLMEGGVAKETFVFDETQQPLSENVLALGTFFKRGAKWITAGELTREGVHKAVDLFYKDLIQSK
jgi:hypothetical protein